MAKDPPSIQAPPCELPFLYHSSRKEDISIESYRGHYHGVSTGYGSGKGSTPSTDNGESVRLILESWFRWMGVIMGGSMVKRIKSA
jgi:hypothetical protein